MEVVDVVGQVVVSVSCTVVLKVRAFPPNVCSMTFAESMASRMVKHVHVDVRVVAGREVSVEHVAYELRHVNVRVHHA